MPFKDFIASLVAVEPLPPDPAPPDTLGRYFMKYMKQIKGILIALAILNMLVALLDVSLPWFVGRIVDKVAAAEDWPALWAKEGPFFLAAALVIAVVIPLVSFVHYFVLSIFMPRFANKVRRQNHWYVLQQDIAFFHDDFAGRIANKLGQTPYALRSTVERGIEAVWYVLIFTGTTLALLFEASAALAVPPLLWLAFYIGTLWYFIPRLRRKSAEIADDFSDVIGKIADSYTNILTVKLFARKASEDRHTVESMLKHTASSGERERMFWVMRSLLTLAHHVMIVSAGAVSLYLWGQGQITAGTIAMALPLLIQMTRMSGWIMMEITMIFENIGVVDDGIKTISRPLGITDRPGARRLEIREGAISIRNLCFHYGKKSGVIENLNLDIPPGQKVGVVGPSGAGKSTLVSLLLRLYEPEEGEILIDHQNIGACTQDSLREQIAVVTQDTSLLHRTLRDNVRYGRPEASEADIRKSLQSAHAEAFVESLLDKEGSLGLDAKVGERGVKLSGGQRQRIAIARAILKNAPILVLDEATSALDSESEIAIRQSMHDLMQGRTVIAIAHRLSTIASLDRLIVMDNGKIVEDGTHDSLLKRGGFYAKLWNLQSGGFLGDGG
ncbi:MAG: ABC transporter ATP-binding protein [Alphaproteobacteria bacterium]|nr:ABC transporter ATP-binding protein [Alphaproteobacteria bacterium]